VNVVASVAGVLCTRVRMEEKRLIAALGSLGVDVRPLPPSDAPLPIQPLSAQTGGGEADGDRVAVVIDRLQERTTASVWLRYWRQPGREMIDAGVAATLDRLSIARLLAEAGLPRPETALVISEASGLNVIDLFEGVGTLLPLQAGARELPLLDRESAEAILEHRSILGEAPDSLSLMQQGVASAGKRAEIVVVDGVAVAAIGAIASQPLVARISALASETARLMGARLIGVTIAEIDGRLVVWDINSVPEFRAAQPIADKAVEIALAALTVRLLKPARSGDDPVRAEYREEAGDHVFLSA
jgi:[lysine-biosynthesis-protein LysW]--L-2-aminoadipate ligase